MMEINLDITTEVKEACADYKKELEKKFSMPTSQEAVIRLAVNSFFLGIAWGSQIAGEVNITTNKSSEKLEEKEKVK